MRALLAILLFATPALAQDRTLDTVAAERDEAEAEARRLASRRAGLERELAELKAQMSTLSRQTAALEDGAAELEGRVDSLVSRANLLTDNIADDRDSLRSLVAVLQRIESNPPPTLATGGGSAIETARAGSLAASVATSLQARADQLAQDLLELEGVRAELSAERDELNRQTEVLNARRAEMRTLSRDKAALARELGQREAAEVARMEALAREAETLRELLAAVERAAGAEPRLKPGAPVADGPLAVLPRIKPPSGSRPLPRAPRSLPEGLRFADARGQLDLPVQGSVSAGFSNDRKGLSISARSGSQVVSPYGGRVEFAGPFKNYERLVILNAGDGYFVVLTGLASTFVASGETVALGEPLGEMPSGDAELYLEFRKDGRPVDPAPWLRGRRG